MSEISVLVGKTLKAVAINNDDDVITFETEDGHEYRMWHRQDCCEHVYVEDVNGNPQDLLDSPIFVAEELTNEPEPESRGAESETWTFYRISTIKGTVTIRWYGSSNGYYSESVSFAEI